MSKRLSIQSALSSYTSFLLLSDNAVMLLARLLKDLSFAISNSLVDGIQMIYLVFGGSAEHVVTGRKTHSFFLQSLQGCHMCLTFSL